MINIVERTGMGPTLVGEIIGEGRLEELEKQRTS